MFYIFLKITTFALSAQYLPQQPVLFLHFVPHGSGFRDTANNTQNNVVSKKNHNCVDMQVGWLRKFWFSCISENFAKLSISCFAKFSFSFAKFSRNTKLKFVRNFLEIRRKFRETRDI